MNFHFMKNDSIILIKHKRKNVYVRETILKLHVSQFKNILCPLINTTGLKIHFHWLFCII